MENKVVVITGGSSGAGEALAYRFSSEGFNVVIGGTNLERLKKVQSNIQSSGSKCEYVVHDVSLEREVKKMIDHTIKSYGRLDVLICNAGISYRSVFENAKLDVLKGFMSKLDSFENALTEATEPKVMKEVQEKIIYREFNPADNKPKVVWRKPVVKEVEQPAMQEDFVSKIAGMMTKDIHAQKAAGLNEQEEKSALETLREEFRSFKQNVISQLASLGGGGAGKLVDLDDVDISSIGNGKFLVYNSSTAKLEFTDQVDGN